MHVMPVQGLILIIIYKYIICLTRSMILLLPPSQSPHCIRPFIRRILFLSFFFHLFYFPARGSSKEIGNFSFSSFEKVRAPVWAGTPRGVRLSFIPVVLPFSPALFIFLNPANAYTGSLTLFRTRRDALSLAVISCISIASSLNRIFISGVEKKEDDRAGNPCKQASHHQRDAWKIKDLNHAIGRKISHKICRVNTCMLEWLRIMKRRTASGVSDRRTK